MKILIVTIINFLLNPILFIEVIIWSRKLKFTKFPRIQYSLFSSLYSLFPIWEYSYKIQKLEFLMIVIIFEIDNYIDQKLKQKEHKEISELKIFIKNLFTNSIFSEILSDYTENLSDHHKPILIKGFQELFRLSIEQNEIQAKTIDEYLEKGRISIAIPFLTTQISLIENEQIKNIDYVYLCAEIIRIINDRESVDKDITEGTQNIYNIFDKTTVDKILSDKIKKFKSYKTTNKIEKHLYKITSLGLKIYNGKDFEL